MTVRAYYQHIRSLGPFRAVDALRVAREAAALDDARRLRETVPFVTVSYEVWPDGSAPLRLGGGIRVF